MFSLFPKQKPRAIFYVCVFEAMIIALLLINPSMNPIILGAVGLIGGAAMFFSQYMRAAQMHNELLARLYNQLNVEGFLRDYEPFLRRPIKNQNLYLMVRLHISNAYCAQGRFDDAIRLLSSISYREDKPEKLLLYKFSVTSNLCYCYEQKGDIARARQYLDRLLDLRKQLEAAQEKKKPSQRMAFNTALNEQCMQFLEKGTLDIDVLRTQVQADNTQQLHRITTSLWIARAYLAKNERREAEKLLRQIVKLAPDLYPGQAAKALLDGLPLPAGEDAEDAQAQESAPETAAPAKENESAAGEGGKDA